jgi:transcriptional regulator with XRE-family HTH domain
MTNGLGEFLRRERELRHISLDEVTERTKISRRLLEAIEEEHYERLPGEAFVRGFIRSYAQSIGLDPQDTLLMYSQTRVGQENLRNRSEQLLPDSPASDSRSLIWLLVAALLVVGGVLFAMMFRDGMSQWRLIWSTHEQRSATLVGHPPQTLTAVADSDTWLRVIIDGQETQEVLLGAGQLIQWIGQEHFSVSVGNARVTHLKLNGRGLSIPEPPQSILRGYIISRDMLQ